MKKIGPQQLEELTLLLVYLTSWDENAKQEFGPNPELRAWKGYDFSILNGLQKQELIEQNNKAKSLFITKKGIEMAHKLIEKFFQED